jgi:hypothetical protein
MWNPAATKEKPRGIGNSALITRDVFNSTLSGKNRIYTVWENLRKKRLPFNPPLGADPRPKPMRLQLDVIAGFRTLTAV